VIMKTDIVVVGAGPAGSTAAEVAVRLGAEVALIDRKAEIGTPVQCGGFLPEASELRALLPRAILPESLVEIPERIMLHRTGVQRIYSPSGRAKEFLVEGRVIDRRNFDRCLVQRAARAGAEVMVSTRASFTPHGLSLSGHFSGPVDAKVVIGADGPSSSIGRGAGMARRSEVGVCLEYEMVGVDIDPRAAEMYFGTGCAPGGYAWIIPLGPDTANVGVGVRSSYLARGAKLRELLDNFVGDHPVAGEKLRQGEIVAIMRGLVPAGGISPSILKGNLLLAGDAAGQVMATSGGGIPLAMVGGRIAGEVAAGHIRSGCGLDEYPSRTADEMGQELENSVRIRRLVDKVMRSDRLMDALLAMIPPEQMKATQRGQIPESLMRVHDLVAKV